MSLFLAQNVVFHIHDMQRFAFSLQRQGYCVSNFNKNVKDVAPIYYYKIVITLCTIDKKKKKVENLFGLHEIHYRNADQTIDEHREPT